MNCPKCLSSQVKCIDTKDNKGRTRRRRECTACGTRFTTVEVLLDEYEQLEELRLRKRFNQI